MNRGRGVVSKPKDTKFVLKKLLYYVLKFKFLFLVIISLTIVSNLFGLIGPYLSGMAINEIDVPKEEIGNINISLITYYVVWMIAFYVISCILSLIMSYLMIYTTQKIVYQMRKDLFKKLMNLPISFYDKSKTGDIISRMSYDIDTINTSLSSDVIAIVSSIISMVGSLFIMIKISWMMLIVILVTLPISLFISRRRAKIVRPLFSKRSKKNGDLNAFVEEMSSGHKTIKTYHKEEQIINNFKVVNDDACDASYKAEYVGFVIGPLMGFISNISLTLICIFGSILYLYKVLQLGDISNFITYSKKFTDPVNEIANISAEIQSALSAGERVFLLMDELDEPVDVPDAVQMTDIEGKVTIKDVSFGYLPNKIIIKDFNLDVKPGSLVAIVGPTGAGKTTLINLLMRFYDVNNGAIYLDDIPITDIKRDSLRRCYSMVLQDTWLFNGTIFENVAYGKHDATLDDVIRVCKAAHIHDYIEHLPDGYNTYLSESGSNISKGQKQLLTIARAMLLESKMLILDEATSNVDTMTEIEINSAMRKLMMNKTCFVIAHRLSTIMNADQIVVIDNGNIVEIGKHEELLEKKGFYASLYYSQFD